MTKRKVSAISTIVNVFLAVAKLLIGWISQSAGILASGIDSLSDILSSFLVYLGIRLSEKKSSSKYPYGLYRAESVTSFIVFLFVMIASLGIIFDSTKSLVGKEYNAEVSGLALGVMVVSAVSSGVLAFYKLRVGRRDNSVSLVLDGKHSMIDVLTSAGVLGGLMLSKIVPIFDSIVGLLIGIYILFETSKMAKEVMEGLLDTADEEAEEIITKLCESEEVKVSEIKSRKAAGKTFVELQIVLPVDIKVKKADKVISNLQKSILEKIDRVEHISIQIAGKGERHPVSRTEHDAAEIPNLPKKGYRKVYPVKDGKIISDFGAQFYKVEDIKDGEVVQSKIIKNPFYRIGRSYGVKFLRYVSADEVVASEIGGNARKMLENAEIKISEK